MNVKEGLQSILSENSTNAGRWFSIMGNPPLRQVFEKALGLPSSIVGVELDQQREIFQERSQSLLGTDQVDEFASPEIQEKLIRLFLIRSESDDIGTTTGSSTALTLLQSSTLRFG
jgi:hypothetical protein